MTNGSHLFEKKIWNYNDKNLTTRNHWILDANLWILIDWYFIKIGNIMYNVKTLFEYAYTPNMARVWMVNDKAQNYWCNYLSMP